jgi:hypothetical protein
MYKTIQYNILSTDTRLNWIVWKYKVRKCNSDFVMTVLVSDSKHLYEQSIFQCELFEYQSLMDQRKLTHGPLWLQVD